MKPYTYHTQCFYINTSLSEKELRRLVHKYLVDEATPQWDLDIVVGPHTQYDFYVSMDTHRKVLVDLAHYLQRHSHHPVIVYDEESNCDTRLGHTYRPTLFPSLQKCARCEAIRSKQ